MSRKLNTLFSLMMLLSLTLTACSGGAQAMQPATEDASKAAEGSAHSGESNSAPQGNASNQQTRTNRTGGWFDEIIFTSVPDPEPAVAQIQADAIDMYSATIDKTEVLAQVQADQKLGYHNTYGSSNQLLFNPVACSDEELLNPFTSAKIREAMNWAIDRNYIVQEIFGGLAKPKYSAFTTAFPDYARYPDLFSVIETQYAYNLEKAKQVVDEEMPKLGATRGADGYWQYHDKPVTIIGLIRTEDKRKEIGEYFSNQLEKLGFKVDRQEKVRSEAGPIWQGDPTPCAFHWYTAGWISDQIQRDEGGNFAQYNTGMVQNLPVFNAFQPSPELLTASEALYTNNFNNMDERHELFKTALTLSMQESWWGVWVNDSIAFVAYDGEMEGASDLAGGFGGPLFPYTGRWAGKEGGSLRIANSGILVDAWNPVGGSTWIDDSIIRNFTTDYGVVSNPYTGLYMPKLVQKAELVVETGLPVVEPQSDWMSMTVQDQINVPDEAWVDWDSANQVFITAAEKAKADPAWSQTSRTKVTVFYTPELWQTTWHDGSNLSLADFIYAMILSFDAGKPESPIFDESMASSVEAMLSHLKGVRILSTDPLIIETYDDQFYLDAENNITDWYPNIFRSAYTRAGMLAWHNLTPAWQAEADGKMAFSKDKSTNLEIDYTSQASGPTLEVQMAYLDQDIASQYIPYAPTLSQYITPEEAVARYTNLKAFYAEHKHLVLGTGPYMVDHVYPVEQSISLVRYDQYIFPADQFTSLGDAKLMELSLDGPTMLAAGSQGSFEVNIFFENQPYPAAEIGSISYILFNNDGSLVATGSAEPVSDGLYQVSLSSEVTAKLNSGTALLTIAAASRVVSLPAMETIEFRVTK